MRVKITTLIDVSETSRIRPSQSIEYKQSCNYNTFLQTISLTSNFILESITENHVGIGNMKFGAMFKGKHKYWELIFSTEAADAQQLDDFIKSFNLVPIITNLTETVTIAPSCIQTEDIELCNTFFSILE